MGRDNYKSEKRRKEIARMKKQEEKRQRRLSKGHEPEEEKPEAVPEEGETSASESAD